ncbi:TPM domain-containing protein [Gordonia soli]|nr:TPM domain-containing protein [Gordonia soli]
MVVRRRLASGVAVSALAVLLSMLGLSWIGAGIAHAEPPTRLPTQVVDAADVLDTRQSDQLQQRLDRLYNEHDIQLWVVYVRNFDNLSAEQWAKQTSDISEFGDRDLVLAVATDTRSYHLSSPGDIEGIDQSTLDDIDRNEIRPALRANNWLAAGLGAADGVSAALVPSNSGWVAAAAVGGVVVVGGGGALLYTRRRRRRRVEDGVESLREQELTVEQLAAQPLDVLDPWSREVLTDTDNAIRTSEEELRLAVSEFGTAETAPFTAALDAARKGLAESFALRQRLDDDVPETADEQRSMLVQIITTCTSVDSDLDEQVESFDTMRNLLINAGARFDELTQQTVALRARLEESEETLTALVAKHGAATLTSIADNVGLAREQIEFAEANTDQGRAAITAPAGEQGAAVADIRSAEGAIEQAGRLLDAIANADSTITAAHSRLPALIEEVDAELVEAGQLSTDGGPALATAVATAQAAVQAARTGFDADPLGTFTALVDADTDLDAALDAARDASAARRRRTEVVDAAIESATAKVGTAADFIATRRGAVQSIARTRLSEAQRLLESAGVARATDPIAAADQARRSGSLADQALMAAQADVVDWQQSQPSTTSAGSGAGAVLGGILVDSFLRGMGGGRGWGGGGSWGGGGYSSGGRSPGSFGGSSSSGRIGVGGRF